MDKKKGHFVISLDFELFWGMFDKHTIETYGESISGVRTAIPKMLEVFSEYKIHATWATLGMLMARNKEELLSLLPDQSMRPKYENQSASSYFYIENFEIGNDEENDKYHFGVSLLNKILKTPNQEIGNHTFSHYYCVDGKENSPEIFAKDLDAFDAISEKHGINATSIVFPRNQTNEESLKVCEEKGITAYRGNEESFIYKSREDKKQSYFIRGLRLLDHYFNLTGHHTYPIPTKENGLYNVKASRFLRPWNKVLKTFEPLRIRRITKAMTHAAKHGEVFHLWWHPHNFGINQTENIEVLRQILDHYKMLREKYGMESVTMSELAERSN